MFRTNSDRLDYSEMLIPPVGYKTAFAVGTTYSLDLETLISVSIALGLNEDIDSKISESPIYMLEALRKVSDKMLIFCEAGQIKAPAILNKLYPILENSVVMVNVRKRRSFHPKVWIIKYENNQGESLYRVLVLSRNLTFDRSWDIAVCLDGTISSKPMEKNRPLYDFEYYLYGRMETGNERMSHKRKAFRKLIEEIMQLRFSIDEKKFDDFDFIPLGISNDYNGDYTGLFSKYHELFIISPFMSYDIMESFKNQQLSNADKTIVTRKSELYKLPLDFLRDFNVYTMKDDIVDGEDKLSEKDTEKQDIHAKLYLRTKYSDSELLIGSANASKNAFEGNIEFLLKFYSKRRYLNVIELKKDIFGEDEKLNPFEKVEAVEYVNTDMDNIQQKLQEAIKNFCRADLSAEVSEGYTITMFIEKLKADNEGVDMYISPILITKRKSIDNRIAFDGLSLSQLSEFYVVTAEMNGEELSRIVKIRTEGIPDDRDSSIFNSIVKNKEGFMQYISFLLGDDYLMSFIEDIRGKEDEYKYLTSSSIDTPVLYEKMLKVAATNPEKLREIKKVMEMISDKNIIPDNFIDLYNIFEKAVLK